MTAPTATTGGEAREHQQHQQQEAASTVQQGKKAARPSSWQRRRAAKQRAQQEEEHAVQQGAAERGQGGADSMEVDREGGEWALPATQDFARLDHLASQAAQALAAAAAVFPEAAAAGAAAAEATAAAAAGGAAGSAGNVGGVAAGAGQCSSWPQRMPRPTDMLLQRSSIFYCASFPRKPGLTTQRKCGMAAGDGRLALQHGLQLGACAAMATVCPMHSMMAAADPDASRALPQTCCTS